MSANALVAAGTLSYRNALRGLGLIHEPVPDKLGFAGVPYQMVQLRKVFFH